MSMDTVWTIGIILVACFTPDILCQGREDGSKEVYDLTSETDFRSVTLHWRYEKYPPPIGFFVTLCEVTPWSRNNNADCFERHLLLGKRNALVAHDNVVEEGNGQYRAVLFGLRMLSNYSISVNPMEEQNRLGGFTSTGTRRANLHPADKILITTKGFSAYARNCLANSSEIVVLSGPHFGGKIAVEGSSDERCALYGNRSSPQDTYVLKIDHKMCGSQTVNDSRIDTVVVVHESSSVVTHNSRRFLVQCNFLPETFTIKAAFNVPQESGDKRNFNYKQLEEALKNVDSNDVFTYEDYKQNHVKDSRMSSEQVQSVLHGGPPGYESQMLSLLVVIIVLIIVIVLVIGLGLWCYLSAHRRRTDSADIETLSTSGSSFMACHVTGDGDALVQTPPPHLGGLPHRDDVYSQTFPRTFYGNQVALVSLKPVKELY
ncbi:uncharacterized protein LOC129217516 [Uloborus diversus]|uniref:uncharacterized protein LOC129217516 n=1 Tax=Uloborus diversus TaxID=327109 RepID=UPI00240A19B0|nr:uncharacterized protein LOC129217516 [Uloborus diversus]